MVGFSAGTGSAFALLPAQNATGNWIKVVQRLPVRIALDPQELEEHPLRIGLSMQADVSIKDDQGGQLGAGAEHGLSDQRVRQVRRQADAEIARIISANAGPNGGSQKSAASWRRWQARSEADVSARDDS